MNGKYNISFGLITMGLFMLYGFALIYLRDFAPDAKEWAESYPIGKHFESRLAHVHGNLFGLVNLVIGYLLLQFSDRLSNVKMISILALLGILMPFGILGEVYLNLPPVLVLIGAITMTASVFLLGISFFKLKQTR